MRFLLLLFFISFSSTAFSAYLWKSNHRSIFQATAVEACTFGNITTTDIIFDSPTQVRCIGIRDGSTINGQYGSATASLRSEACPSPYVEDSSGFCVESSQCPASGEVRYLTGQLDAFPPSPISSGGCEYSYFYDPDNTKNCVKKLDGTKSCTFSYISTGQQSTTNPSSGVLSDTNPDIQGSVNDVDSTEDTVYGYTGPDALPDGSTTQTDTVTTTSVTDSGTTITDQNDLITIVDSDGTISVYSENTTMVTLPTGEVTETITQDLSTTSPDKTTTVIDKTTSNQTTINSTGSTTTNNTTIVNQYASDGTLTSSSTDSQASTDSNGSGDGQGEGGLCENLGGLCEWLMADSTPPEQAELPTEEINPMDLEVQWSSGLGSGSCPSPTTTSFNGKTITRDYTEECNAVSTVFKPILIFFSLIGAGFVVAGVKF